MAEFSLSLDNLIESVRGMHPDGTALDHLCDAMLLAGRLSDHADALIGHFVDQARRSGASWSEIGSSMGVSKQAAQKRFVPSVRMFSRFTDRARRSVVAAAGFALADGTPITVDHLFAGTISDPKGLAALIVSQAGITTDALGIPDRNAPDYETVAQKLPTAEFDGDAQEALEATLHTALRLGHNYIGTEHLLLAILSGHTDTSHRLSELGLNAIVAEEQVNRLLGEISQGKNP
ncbi:Putative Clp protease subunit [Mycobacteroides abscessus subsp. massiliense]|uniref:Clp protease N-terminal domain-containing protein n=1 Tax=Mycobacteroides abscessus TaxID=36809 RepID=UPI0009A75E64|nr:Clp protease N-terminal domain-containing protein [Mycobacteroides abscessus]SKT94558.1 Putative Clp protease subunit [Mycobacteroides abscessus subsp. massiliense]